MNPVYFQRCLSRVQPVASVSDTMKPELLQPRPPPTSLGEAMQRIEELENALDESINIILKRDAQLQKYEREIAGLTEKLDEFEETSSR